MKFKVSFKEERWAEVELTAVDSDEAVCKVQRGDFNYSKAKYIPELLKERITVDVEQCEKI